MNVGGGEPDESTVDWARGARLAYLESSSRLRAPVVQFRGWDVVPAENGRHFSEDQTPNLIRGLETLGCSRVFAICAEGLGASQGPSLVPELPPGTRTKMGELPEVVIVPSSAECFERFNEELGFFSYLLLPRDESLAILCTTEDYNLLAGPRRFVETAVGAGIDEAWGQFERYATDAAWEERTRRFLTALITVYKTPFRR